MTRRAALLAPLIALILAVAPAALRAQEGETLTVEIETPAGGAVVGEMLLLTIRGLYLAPITLEKLVQPDLDGFAWTQLGQDQWEKVDVRGREAKTLTRRMAVFPQRPGALEIGPFTHELEVLSPRGERMKLDVLSPPVAVEVAPAPDAGWWFPVRHIEVSDNWSNAPDQLAPGEAALRIVTITALGATPDMMPPMPELTSPSAAIFAHPEKRLLDLSPAGPVARVFWRWTVRPKGGAAITEPIEIAYFDTETREEEVIRLGVQRVARGLTAEEEAARPAAPAPLAAAGPGAAGSEVGGVAGALEGAAGLASGFAVPAAAVFGLALGLGATLRGRRRLSSGALAARLRAALTGDADLAALRRAGRAGDAAAARAAAARLAARASDAPLSAALARFDRALYGGGAAPEPREVAAFARDAGGLFRRAR